ncbi:mitochondrial fission factor homolog B [Danio rerio]|uniref:Mitochondrial fission factor homolog B n=2 Tax=Danio rerio TaxID=7955 RepID=MFFB_DANRE|nr:mitochondrial fission factor homolog B [Danio rerio]Q7SZQ4.1 RecName: Full=Mitochondrial fission factor homolog B [Danio rerio]AAH56301.1 Zgc:66022 [Danio rerio]|eukprot:NP_956830.1 mitochondrial fission factor homolog B [Danio rerio]
MSGAAFPSPTAEIAEMNRIHYELEYTEGISQRMRIPEQLKVAPYGSEDQELPDHELLHTAMMHVPERIIVAGHSDDMPFPRDLDLIQSTPQESTLSLKTPPRVLTLSDRPLDFLEMEQTSSVSHPSEEVRTQTKTRRERSVSENAGVHHNGPLARNDSAFALATLDSTLEGGTDDMAVVDATSLRRQIVKLNRRLQLLEEENKERAKREMVMYSITVAFWLVNSWVWFRR